MPEVMEENRPGAGFRWGEVEVFGHSVGYAESGAGSDVLVICPGSAGSDASWAKDQLAERMRVVELNPPGWGGAEPLRHPMDQRELAVILAAALDRLGIERYRLHGASMGGVTALWLAVQFSDRVQTLSTEGGMNFVEERSLVSPDNVRALADAVARDDPDGEGYPQAAPHPRKPWADEAHFRGQMRKRIPMMRMLGNAHEDELAARMDGFAVPTLAMIGTQDELLTTDHLQRWRDVLPTVETLAIEGAMHDIQNTEPEAFVDALTDFWRRHS